METILGYVIGIILVMLVLKIIFKSTGLIIKVLINALIGGGAIWLLNLFGVGIHLNWITAVLVGAFGVPGVILVLLLQFVFHVL